MLKSESLIFFLLIFAVDNSFAKILTAYIVVNIYNLKIAYKEAGAKQPDLLGVRDVVI